MDGSKAVGNDGCEPAHDPGSDAGGDPGRGAGGDPGRGAGGDGVRGAGAPEKPVVVALSLRRPTGAPLAPPVVHRDVDRRPGPAFPDRLTIDCAECAHRSTDVCGDCVVSFIVGREPDDALVIDADEARAVRLLEQAGLVPGVRHEVRAAGG